MDIYITEEEQIQRIKAWLKEYGPTIIITLIVVLLVSFGWHYWQNRQESIRVAASVNYEEMLASAMGNDTAATQLRAENLINHYAATPYANLAAFMLAKLAVEQNQYPTAQHWLHWVIQHSQLAAVRQIARNRTAQLLIAEQKPQQAITLLAKVDDQQFAPMIDALRGDAYVAMKNFSSARQAYIQALKALPENDANWPLLQMKLNEIAGL